MSASPQQQKLLQLLRELFQLDQPDLDFGLYRIMHAKAAEIEKFLEQDLLATITQTVGGNQADLVDQAQAEYERKRQAVIDDGGDPDASRQVQQALADYRATQQSQGEDVALYEHLYKFFERYYDNGDFLSRRFYARETVDKAAPYAVPYDGSEVYLHWANKDQYYIKTAENFRQFTVDLAQAKSENTLLFSGVKVGKLHFAVVEADEGAHNNVKASSEKERYFILDAETPVEWHDYALTLRFHYRADEEKTGQAGRWREARNQLNEQAIISALQAVAQGKGEYALPAQAYHAALTTEVAKGKDGTQSLLAKYLNQYTAKNSMDYFIHKNLGGFLKRELDFYIKNEIFRLDDLGSADAPNAQQYEKLLKNALTLRSVAHKIITFLAQTEDFQKKLWLKKKFVVDTQWLVTLDKVPASLYAAIKSNDAQWAEWLNLGFIEAGADRDALLKPDSKLVLDTCFFTTDFTEQLIAHISQASGNLDETTDGVLVHSENFQALNLMQSRYLEQVKAVYIDPPYNTDASEIIYKNAYKNSSWMSLLEERLKFAKNLMASAGAMCATIDDFEFQRLKFLIDSCFSADSVMGIAVIKNNPSGRSTAKGFSISHEYGIFVGKTESVKVGRLEHSEKQVARYKLEDDKGKFEWVNFRKHGGANANRYARKKLFYPIFISENNGVRFPDIFWKQVDEQWDLQEQPQLFEKIIYPINSNNEEKTWKWGYDTAKLNTSEFSVRLDQDGELGVYIKARINVSGTLPLTVWDKKEYSSTEYGTNHLKKLFGESEMFSFPKSYHAVIDSIKVCNSESDALILDFFAGSGTTGQAVIDLNREDEGDRRYILVEQGDYFDTVLKPRIAKVIYSADWKDGKPTAPETGISQLVKVIRLESYEDTLNNLQVQDALPHAVQTHAGLREEYFLHYLLQLQTEGSPSLLNVALFDDPMGYTLKIKKPGSDAQETRSVDLIETFNWLLGLRVRQLFAPQTYSAEFIEEIDPTLPADAKTRLVVNGTLEAVNDGDWWFRAVSGEPNLSSQRVLVVWRKLTGDAVRDSLVLVAYLLEVHQLDVRHPQAESPYDVLYVNGSHGLPNLPQCEIRQTEEAFHRLMWECQDA